MRVTPEEVEEAVRELWIDFSDYPFDENTRPTEHNVLRKIEELNEVELTPEEIDNVWCILRTDERIGDCSDTIYFV